MSTSNNDLGFASEIVQLMLEAPIQVGILTLNDMPAPQLARVYESMTQLRKELVMLDDDSAEEVERTEDRLSHLQKLIDVARQRRKEA
jgi:hypothetical protein